MAKRECLICFFNYYIPFLTNLQEKLKCQDPSLMLKEISEFPMRWEFLVLKKKSVEI